MNSRCRVVTGAKMACGASLPASSATTGVQTSARYGANAAFSNSQTRLAPHSPSCFNPSGVALSVTHTASACAPAAPARRDGLAQHLGHHLLGCALPIVLNDAPVRAWHVVLSVSLTAVYSSVCVGYV